MNLHECPTEIENLVIKSVHELERVDQEPQTLVNLRLKLKLDLESREHVLSVYPELEDAIGQLLDTAFERQQEKGVELSIPPTEEGYAWRLHGSTHEVSLPEVTIAGKPKLALGLSCQLVLSLDVLCPMEALQQLLSLYTDEALCVTTTSHQLHLFEVDTAQAVLGVYHMPNRV